MAMSDLELLQLVEQAQQNNKGEKGEPGVSVERIEQFDDSSFTIFLSNGFSKKITLQPGQDGPVGPIGIQGERGEPGPAGRPGNDGAAGTNGKDGLPGRDGSYVDTAVVNGNGHLLLGLSDGQIIDVGRVVGPVGATGDRGATGLPGEPGMDGAAVLSGPRAPQESDGEEGDHWIDLSSAEFCFYKKGGNGWTKLANLRQPAQDRLIGAGVGGGNGNGGGSGGGGTSQTTATLPLANPTRIISVRGLPDTSNLKTQADYNAWAHDALESLVSGVSPELDLSSYAKTDYVDQADNALSGRIQAVEQDYTTSGEFSTVSQQVTTNKNDIKALQDDAPDLSTYASKQDLATATGALPYRLETDKVMRSGELPEKQNAFDDHVSEVHAGGEIQLVNNLGHFHNITFTGEHGIETRSDQSGIIVDGTALQSRIATLEQQVATLVELVPPVDYGTVTVSGGNDFNAETHACWLPQNETGVFTCSLSGSQTHGCRYKWTISRGSGRISGSDNLSVVTMQCTDPAPNTVVLRCDVSHPTTEDVTHGEVQILVQDLN